MEPAGEGEYCNTTLREDGSAVQPCREDLSCEESFSKKQKKRISMCVKLRKPKGTTGSRRERESRQRGLIKN